MIKSITVLFLALVAAPAATSAAVVASDFRPYYVTSDGNGTHQTTLGTDAFGVNHDGVADLILDGISRCSGSLLFTGRHLLTAAHCVTDDFGNFDRSNVNVTWELASGNITASTSDLQVHPSWNGNVGDGYDLAILTFATAINSLVPRYNYYREPGFGEIGVQGIKVGYGQTGIGSGGSTGASGSKRAGLNEWEDDGLDTVGGINNESTQLTYDFDSGQTENDAFQFFFGAPEDLGFGNDEVGAAPGDSGGPTFIFHDGEYQIAGVTSYGFRLFSTEDGSSSDVDNATNSSWGEFVVDARTADSEMLSFLDSVTGFDATAVPEPATLAFFFLGGIGVIFHRHTIRTRRFLHVEA